MSASRLPSVLLLRHAETDWNARGVVQGQLDDARLTEAGTLHASSVGRTMRGSIDAIVSSDLTRAVATAELVASECGVTLAGCDPRLRERSFGELEGRPLEELTPAHTGIREARVVDDEARAPRGESLRELLERVASWASDHKPASRDARLLVVTHGGTIRALRAYAAGASLLGLPWDRVANCSTWPIELPSGDSLEAS